MAHPRRPLSILGLAIITALVFAACSGDSTSAGSTGAPSSTVPTATTTAPPNPVAYGPTALVSSEEACDLNNVHGTTTTDPDGTVHIRGGWFTCTVTSNDPRVAGTARYTWNADQWGEGADNGSMAQWGVMRISNSKGAWTGRWQGIYTSETGDLGANLLVGSGDYAGLSYYRWAYKTFGSTWPTEGLIFPSATQPR